MVDRRRLKGDDASLTSVGDLSPMLSNAWRQEMIEFCSHTMLDYDAKWRRLTNRCIGFGRPRGRPRKSSAPKLPVSLDAR